MHNFQEQCENCVSCNGVFVIIFFETMYVKKNLDCFFVISGVIKVRVTEYVTESASLLWEQPFCVVLFNAYIGYFAFLIVYTCIHVECVFMVQCGKSNMIWKRFYGATRSVWCDRFLSRKVYVLKSYYCIQVLSLIFLNWTSPLKLAKLGCFKDNYQSLNNNYILGHYQCSLCANFTYKWNFLAA